MKGDTQHHTLASPGMHAHIHYMYLHAHIHTLTNKSWTKFSLVKTKHMSNIKLWEVQRYLLGLLNVSILVRLQLQICVPKYIIHSEKSVTNVYFLLCMCDLHIVILYTTFTNF